jgi:predicted Zn-dependent peptidase
VTFHHQVLPNGLNIISEISPSARSVSIGFFVRTGARDEKPDISGVSHFLEHMVFKGTPRRTALEVNMDFDRIGANYNAFTSEENTVFYASILPEYLPEAVDILSDILRPSLRGEDFDMEKKVIIEEIGMYEDQPTWSAYDQAKKAFFADHPLGNSVLGTPASITALKREQMQAYFDRRYVAANVTVAAAGNFSFPQLVKLLEKRCGHWNTGRAPRLGVREAPPRMAFQVVKKDKVTQEHVFMISPGPAADSPLRHAADTLAMVLGDDTGSRLYWALVDPGLAESADVGYHDYEGAGSFFTSFSSEPEQTQKNLAIIRGIFRQVQKDGISEAELAQAKSKILSRVVRASERPMGRMQAIGMSWIYLGKYRSVDDELKAFDAVDLKKIGQVLERYPFDELAILALGPLKKLRAPLGNGKK